MEANRIAVERDSALEREVGGEERSNIIPGISRHIRLQHRLNKKIC